MLPGKEPAMYRYPEIDGPSKAPHEHCLAFDKLDGSNMRFEWSPKRGWYKFGSRGQLIDPHRGARDLEERWLRHVSPAFAEDPVS
jgi:hypothetical protein